MKHITLILLSLFALNVSALNPSRTYKQLPDKLNMIYEEHKVDVSDGAKLVAWYFPNQKKSTKMILVSHNGEGNMADYLSNVDMLLSIGYNVLIYDYRGFGESSEFEMDKNMYIYPHFQDDVIAMIDFCRKQFAPTFYMYGWGMGAGLSLGIGYNRPEVKRIIADTPFLSMEHLEMRFSSWDEPMEVPFAGYDKKYEPIYSLDLPPQKTLEKILLIIGNYDPLLKLDDMKSLKKKQPEIIAPIYEVTNPDRIDNFLVDKVGYTEAIKKFLSN